MYGADALGDVAGTISVVADIVAGAGFSALLQALSPRGRYVCAGAIAGPEVCLDLRTLYLKRLTLVGSTLGTREDFARLVSWIESGRVHPLLAAAYPLEQLPEAQACFVSKDFVGKLVVTLD